MVSIGDVPVQARPTAPDQTSKKSNKKGIHSKTGMVAKWALAFTSTIAYLNRLPQVIEVEIPTSLPPPPEIPAMPLDSAERPSPTPLFIAAVALITMIGAFILLRRPSLDGPLESKIIWDDGKNRKEAVKKEIDKKPESIGDAPKEWLEDTNFIAECLLGNLEVLKYIPLQHLTLIDPIAKSCKRQMTGDLLQIRQKAINFLQRNPFDPKPISIERAAFHIIVAIFKSDKEFFCQIKDSDALFDALQLADPKLLVDQTFMKEMAIACPKALTLSPTLQKNRQFIKGCIQERLEIFEQIDRELKENTIFIEELIPLNGEVIKYDKSYEARRSDVLVEKAVKQTKAALQYATLDIRGNLNFLLKLAKQDLLILDYADQLFHSNEKLLACNPYVVVKDDAGKEAVRRWSEARPAAFLEQLKKLLIEWQTLDNKGERNELFLEKLKTFTEMSMDPSRFCVKNPTQLKSTIKFHQTKIQNPLKLLAKEELAELISAFNKIEFTDESEKLAPEEGKELEGFIKGTMQLLNHALGKKKRITTQYLLS